MSFSPKALDLVHRYTSGIPRLINLVCDRALLGGYSARSNRITPEMVGAAATGLDLAMPGRSMFGWLRRGAAAFAAGAALTAAVSLAAAYAVIPLHSRSVSAGTIDPPASIQAGTAAGRVAGSAAAGGAARRSAGVPGSRRRPRRSRSRPCSRAPDPAAVPAAGRGQSAAERPAGIR